MAFSDTNLEEKIANIKFALKELGNSLENDEIVESNKGKLNQINDQAKVQKLSAKAIEKNDLKLLLDYEREKNTMLEVRIAHKDELLTEMTILQNELYANIEELQNKVNSLKSDLEYFHIKNSENSKEIENFTQLLQQKDLEINQILQDRDRFMNFYAEKDEESKLLTQELSLKEPEKSLMNALVLYIQERRNQELLLEVDTANKLITKYLNNSNLNQDFQHKLKLAEEKLEKNSKDHHIETSALLGKISKLEEQISKPISDDLYEEIKVLKEKNKNYAVLKGIFTDICQALLIDEDQSDKICGKIKEIENKGNIYFSQNSKKIVI